MIRTSRCALAAAALFVASPVLAEEGEPDSGDGRATEGASVPAELVPAELPEEEAPPLATSAPMSPEEAAWEAFDDGLRHFEAEEFTRAARSFRRAYDLVPRPTVRFNIARAFERAGRPEEARRHYEAFVDAGVGSPERRRLAMERIANLSGESARLVISTHPPGGTVHVDGRSNGQEPVSVAVRPGVHEIEVRLRGVASRRRVEVARDERRRLAFALHSPGDADGGLGSTAGRRRRTLPPLHFSVSLGVAGLFTATTIALFSAVAVIGEPTDAWDDRAYVYSDLMFSADVFLFATLITPLVSLVLAYYTDWERPSRRGGFAAGAMASRGLPLGFCW